MPTSDPVKKFEEVVENQARNENDRLQQANADTIDILQDNIRQDALHDAIQESNANDYNPDDTYTDR
jgi:NADPH-dependent curcumin reductase CurA